jgi:hypothetical protein
VAAAARHQSTITEETHIMASINRINDNATVIHFADGVSVLWSYKTPVAAFIPGRGYIKTDRRFSVTTSRHINAWVWKTCDTVPHAEIEAIANAR